VVHSIATQEAGPTAMVEVRKTQVFEDWFISLRDRGARLRIQVRIDR
jgi:putative component of toxin-antitoxin plasmid stabilization module